MANTTLGGRQVEVGIGIETTPGTPVTATDYFKWDNFTMQSIVEKSIFNSARGIRNKASNSIISRKYGKGDIDFVPTVDIMPYIFSMVMGTKVSSVLHTGETTVYDHTFAIQNSNASMKSATLLIKQGGIQTERYANCVADTFNLTLDKDFGVCKIGLLSGFPDTGSMTPSYTQDTLLSRNDMSVQFGTSIATAGSASATPLVSFSMDIENSVLIDDAFLSGSNIPVAGGFMSGVLTIKGSYTLQFANTTELAKYQADTKNAVIVTISGASIGTVPSKEQIIIKLGKLILTKEPIEYQIDGINFIKQEFEVQYDATDKEMAVVVTNTNVGTNY